MLYLLLCFSLAAAYPGKYFQNTQRYDGYQVLSLRGADQHQTDLIHTLADNPELDFYVEAHTPGVESSVLVPANKLAAIKSFLERHGIEYHVEVEDLQQLFDAEQARLIARYERNGGKFAYDKFDFNTYDDVMGELINMQEHCPSTFDCVLENIGNSVEGRPIMALTVSKGENRPAFWFDSAIHAREWISLTTLMLMMDNIIYNYGVDADATRLLDNYDFVFVPIMNPDGYEFSWTNNPNWRKSRNNNPGSSCIGTDLNRNYNFMWANVGSSFNPCSDTYHGLGPADQPETQHVQNKMLSVADNLVGLTTIHCQGRMWLIPYGFQENNQCAYPSDYDDMYAVAEATADAIQAVHNTVWTRGSICSTIYPAAGGTCDYAHGVGGIKYSSTPELRSRAVFADIIPSYQEVWQGVLAMVNKIEEIEGLKE